MPSGPPDCIDPAYELPGNMMNPTLTAKVLLTIVSTALVALQGCAEKLPDGPRVPTTPVVGQVLVDGKPAGSLSVGCEAQFEKDQTVPHTGAFTDKDGKFALSTFESGDGVPLGKYKLTFMWGQFNLMNGQYGGPDKLGGKYRKGADSNVEFEVDKVSKEKLDLGTIELTTKK